MRRQDILNLLSLACIAALTLWAGCKKGPEHTADDGHGHGRAHVEVQDGIAMCTEHNVPEARCGICRPELAGQLKAGEGLKVRLPSMESTRIVDIRTEAPSTGEISEGIECLAEVSFNQNRLAQIVAPVGGILQSVDADLGDQVGERQTVARIWSASIAEAVAKAVLTHQILGREQRLRADKVTSLAALQEAEAAHRAACQPLRTLGFTEEQIETLGSQPQDQVLMEVRTPFAGEIVERTAVRGALVDMGRPLFTISDRSVMWAILQVPETALDRVESGQAVELWVDSLPDRVFTGRLTWIGPAVDVRSRMIPARAEFADPNGLLKDRMFARAKILTRREDRALLVPDSAVQRVEARSVVFVRLADDLYDARGVDLGVRQGGLQEVLAGLEQHDEVAVTHTFALKSAMLMSRLGAGCADD